jgi:hypothetical protein
MEQAKHYAGLDLNAHRVSKLRLRRNSLRALRRALWADRLDFIKLGMKRSMGR